jgi:phosphatidylglycerol:prolipoprotein diacylglycerol transferase
MFPRVLHIYGPLWIHGYGLMIAAGFLVFSWLLFRDPIRKKLIPDDIFFNAIFIGLVAGVAGGRLFYVLQHWELFANNPIDIVLPWVGGLVLLGSISVVALTIPLYLWWKKVEILPTLDIAAFYAPLFESIARFGCFFAGCCYGCPAPEWLPWAVTFTNEHGAAPLNQFLHPSQIYTSLTMLCIFFLIVALRKHFHKVGRLAFFYLMLENVARFSVDFWRGDQEAFVVLDFIKDGFMLSSSQMLSLKGAAISLICFVLVSLRKSKA